jgi:AraC family transcriptional regulator, regulatory protein of adaptative response / DNA-3-methyladenine glycosylase II
MTFERARILLETRRPFDGLAIAGFLGARAVPGVESWVAPVYRRSLRLEHGLGTLAIEANEGGVEAAFRLEDARDFDDAVARCRRLFDLDADPDAVAAALGDDPQLGPLVRRRPGLRVPGSVDPDETAIRAVLGQQVSVAGARTIAGRLAERFGEGLPEGLAIGDGVGPGRAGVDRLFPAPAALLAAEDADLPMPAARRVALRGLARALADGTLRLTPGMDPLVAGAALVALPGIGPWTAAYVRMRALGDGDAFLPTDLGVRRAVAALGVPDRPAEIEALAERWRPWRAYALMHLWHSAT